MPEMTKKVSRVVIPHAEVQDAVEAALNQLGAEPNEAGWAKLAPLIGVTPKSLYNAYLGHSNLGRPAYLTLRAIAAGSPHGPDRGLLSGAVRVREDDQIPAGTHEKSMRWVPMVSWAHMGDSTAYEEIPKAWQERIPTDCPDPDAFAVTLVGDCMEPRYFAGEIAIVMPGVDVRPGCLVLAKLRDDGVIFRRYHEANKTVRLMAYNSLYPEMMLPADAFHWIYPVYGTIKRDWR